MTDHPDIVERLRVAAIVLDHLPELPGFNGSALTIDDVESARCAKAMFDGAAEITRLRAEAEALRKDATRWRFTNENWFQVFEPMQHWKVTTATGKVLHEGLARTYEAAVDAAIAATKEQQA